MKIRDRITGLRRVKAGQLRPHPGNWRTHPPAQADAVRGILAEIGYADALLARELADGSLELIDGHLRAQITPDEEVPVLVVDLDDAEAAKLLALLDPLAAMAESNEEALSALLEVVQTENASLQGVLDDLAAEQDGRLGGDGLPDAAPREVEVPEVFQVVVACRDEQQQREVYERLSGEGFSCRLQNL